MTNYRTLETTEELSIVFSQGNIIVVDPLSSECFIYEQLDGLFTEGEYIFLSESLMDNLDKWEKKQVIACDQTDIKPQGYYYHPWDEVINGERGLEPSRMALKLGFN